MRLKSPEPAWRRDSESYEVCTYMELIGFFATDTINSWEAKLTKSLERTAPQPSRHMAYWSRSESWRP